MGLKKICNACGCNTVIGCGEKYCERHKAERQRDHRHYDRNVRNKDAKKFYDSVAWQKTRKRVLARDQGIDVYIYVREQRIVAAQHVHHIIPREENKNKQYDLRNLISLSHSTHSIVEKRYKQGAMEKKQMQDELKQCLDWFAKEMGGSMK